MTATIRALPLATLLSATILLTACGPAGPGTTGVQHPAPRAASCEDPVYLSLRAAEPDSLSEREWTRLHQLEELCMAERRAAREPVQQDPPHRAGMHDSRWIWMPAMMVFGGLMWLMMAG